MSHSFLCTTTHYEGLCVLTNTQTYRTFSGHSLTSHAFPGHTTLYCTNTSTDTHTFTLLRNAQKLPAYNVKQ